MKESIKNLVHAAAEGNSSKLADDFKIVIHKKISELMQNKKIEMAKTLFNKKESE